MKQLKDMVSSKCYDEIADKLRKQVGEESFPVIFPAVEKAIEQGSANARDAILWDWLEVDSCRVCSHCGEIMEEGWYLGAQGYACSDECCKALMHISDEEFDRFRIYRDEVRETLVNTNDPRQPEDLTQEEIETILDGVVDGLDAYFYTSWY